MSFLIETVTSTLKFASAKRKSKLCVLMKKYSSKKISKFCEKVSHTSKLFKDIELDLSLVLAIVNYTNIELKFTSILLKSFWQKKPP